MVPTVPVLGIKGWPDDELADAENAGQLGEEGEGGAVRVHLQLHSHDRVQMHHPVGTQSSIQLFEEYSPSKTAQKLERITK